MTTPYVDSHGKRLDEYPRPSVAVDTAVLTVTPESQLAVLLVRTGDGTEDDSWRLPGTFLHTGERLADAVARSLIGKAGVTGLSPRQLHVFDAPDRDPRGWVLSVAHVQVVRFDALEGPQELARLAPVHDLERASLPYGHGAILDRALESLRRDYAAVPDPAALVPSPFTLSELRRVHEAVAGVRLLPDAFRRLMEPQLEPTESFSSGSVGKPARLFRLP